MSNEQPKCVRLQVKRAELDPRTVKYTVRQLVDEPRIAAYEIRREPEQCEPLKQ